MWFEAPESIIQEGLDVESDTKKRGDVPDWAKEDVDVADVQGPKLAIKP